MRKIIILLLLIGSTTIFSQSIKNKLGSSGNFLILDSGVEGSTEKVKFQLKEDGTVLWYLDGADMFIRDGGFDLGDGNGATTKYDFLHVDGGKGRIGFNILADSELPLTSSIHLMGSIAKRVRIIPLGSSENYTVLQDDNILIINKSDNTTSEIYLPTVDSSKGRGYKIKRNDNKTGKVNLTVQSGEKINGDENGEVSLNTDNASVEVVCDGIEWWVLTELDVVSTGVVTTDINLGKDRFIEVNFSSNEEVLNVTLPVASDYDGYQYELVRNGNGTTFTTNTLNIKPTGSEELSGYTNSSPYIMSNDYESVTVRSNGSRWLIISNYGH